MYEVSPFAPRRLTAAALHLSIFGDADFCKRENVAVSEIDARRAGDGDENSSLVSALLWPAEGSPGSENPRVLVIPEELVPPDLLN